jgi:molecular chaperone DnaK (HSP70)
LAAKYIIGIDLGTTNSALARCDATVDKESSRIEVHSIPQLVDANEVAERTMLPSFLYIPGEFDFPTGSLALPWEPKPKLVIGELARKRGAESPNRLVASAKSWLSYAAVDRSAPILPWQAPEEVPKLSPIEASSQFLQYLRTVWDSGEAGEKGQFALAEQDVLLTVPASFDEEARELTRRAAEQAGYDHFTLLEEPQAAFYAWLESQGDAWHQRIKVGDLVLVCDIGGGTTDFSLILVSEENGELTLKRVAVGDHILLGGDNMDVNHGLIPCSSQMAVLEISRVVNALSLSKALLLSLAWRKAASIAQSKNADFPTPASPTIAHELGSRKSLATSAGWKPLRGRLKAAHGSAVSLLNI